LTTRLDIFVSKKYFTKVTNTSQQHSSTATSSTMSSQSKSLHAMTLLVLATAMLFSVGFLKGVEGRKLLQEEETFPSEDILEEQDLIGEEYAMAMAPAPAPAPTMMTMEEESIVVEGEGEVPAKRRRSLLQELGNGPVPSGEEILGEIYDIYDEMFAPAPSPATTTEEEEILPPVRRKLLQMMEGMMPDMTGMPDPLPSTGDGAMDEGEAPSPAPTATTDEEILDEEVIPPVRKLLQEEGDVIMDGVIAVPPTEAPIAEGPAPAPIEDIGMIVEETPGRKLLQEELEPQPVINGEEEQEVRPMTEEEEATAEAPSPIIGTFEITTITGTITAAEEDYDPDMTGPN
jgi:hypothetical protein